MFAALLWHCPTVLRVNGSLEQVLCLDGFILIQNCRCSAPRCRFQQRRGRSDDLLVCDCLAAYFEHGTEMVAWSSAAVGFGESLCFWLLSELPDGQQIISNRNLFLGPEPISRVEIHCKPSFDSLRYPLGEMAFGKSTQSSSLYKETTFF